jgi:parallel beta-helix repeat protein
MPGRVWRVGVGPKSDFPTLQKAADAAQPGDTVVLEPGLHGGFRTMRNGTKNAPITFRGEPGAIIHVNGNSPPDHVAVRHDWIVVTGFTVRHAQRAGISVIEASDVVVSNNVVGPNGVWAIFTGFAPRVRIENNKAFGSAKQHGIYVSNSREPADRPIVRGNECYANAASGIQLNGDCRMEGDGILHEALIENNVLHDNDSKALSLISIEDCLIQNNLIFRNGRRDGAAGIHLTDEPGCGKPSRRNLVVNNTIVESRMAGIRLSDQAQDNILFNNLMVGRGITDEVGLNQIDAASNHVAKEPRDVFAQPENGDYRLRPLLPLPAGASNYAGRTAPKQDLSGMRRDELRPAIGACDTQCEELPLPGKFDAAAEAAWNPASYQTP